MQTLTRLLLAAVFALVLGACRTVPAPPEKVEVVVEKLRPLPTWATEQYQVPVPANGTVGARLANEDAALGLVELLLCHRRLLARLDKGETVDPKVCGR